MHILIVNNYYKPQYQNRVGQIIEALKETCETKCKLIDFRNISTCEIEDKIKAVILSGSSAHLGNPTHLHIYEKEMEFIQSVNVPLLGICFGHQLIGKVFGSKIKSLSEFLDDFKEIEILEPDQIFSSWERGDKIMVCQSHQDYVANLPENFTCLAKSENCKIEAMKHDFKPIYGVQAHIERISEEHPDGWQILKNFLENVVKS